MNKQIQLISEEEREEIIRYGIKRGKVIFLSTLITILMGWLLGIFWQSIIFWFSLSILRKYAGGYHADTEKRCYVISFIMVLASLLCIKLINYSGEIGIVLQTISLLVIVVLAPVENINHILDKDEKRRYGNKSKIIAILVYFTYIFFCLTNKQQAAISVGMGNLLVTIGLLLGEIHKNLKIECEIKL